VIRVLRRTIGRQAASLSNVN